MVEGCSCWPPSRTLRAPELQRATQGPDQSLSHRRRRRRGVNRASSSSPARWRRNRTRRVRPDRLGPALGGPVLVPGVGRAGRTARGARRRWRGASRARCWPRCHARWVLRAGHRGRRPARGRAEGSDSVCGGVSGRPHRSSRQDTGVPEFPRNGGAPACEVECPRISAAAAALRPAGDHHIRAAPIPLTASRHRNG